jgi:hypothetical protein
MFLPLVPLFAHAALALPGPDTTRVAASLDTTWNAGSSAYRAFGAFSVFGSVTAYRWKPLVDDPSPRSLQSFLQRTSYVAFDVGAQYLLVDSPVSERFYTQHDAAVSASLRWFVLPYGLLPPARVGGCVPHHA